jgi:phospholipase C
LDELMRERNYLGRWPLHVAAWPIRIAIGLAAFVLLCGRGETPAAGPSAPVTPITHLVVIFQENHSFDGYFATYPLAANPPGQPAFRPRPGTPSVNGLMDQFPRFDAQGPKKEHQFCRKTPSGYWGTVMGCFDGNTVTAYWSYAQHFALSDNSFATMSGDYSAA